MEAKTVLGLIKNDIVHLEEIMAEFSPANLPSNEEIEVAVFRAKALVTELELLHKAISLINKQVTTTIVGDNLKGNLLPSENEQKDTPPIIEAITELQIDTLPDFGTCDPLQPESDDVPQPKPEPEPEGIPEYQEPLNEELKTDIIEIPIRETQEELVQVQNTANAYVNNDKVDLTYQNIAIKSIKEEIAINDRFLFTRELFGNDSAKFETTVTVLDQLPSIQEAVNFLKMNFKWSNSETSQKFLGLVKRRFIK